MPANKVVERIEVDANSLFYREHLARYHFSETYIQPGYTLDIATGTGYGADILAQHTGVSVIGVDIDLASLAQAYKTYKQISFMNVNGLALPFMDKCLQNIVTLETIEHIEDDHSYVQELARVLRPDGVCIVSTPNREHSLRHNRVNPYHVREYIEPELMGVLQTGFHDVRIFFQGYSSRYYDNVRQYSEAIQADKQKLNPAVQFAINHVYRPIKQHIPTSATNFFIHAMLKRTYPQPDFSDVTISDKPVEDTNVFIAVCKQPYIM